ncbi:hypothetical protein AB1E18_010522 [Capra hircus]
MEQMERADGDPRAPAASAASTSAECRAGALRGHRVSLRFTLSLKPRSAYQIQQAVKKLRNSDTAKVNTLSREEILDYTYHDVLSVANKTGVIQMEPSTFILTVLRFPVI